MQSVAIKQILANMCFKTKEKNILSMEVMWNVLDEVRKERKILMVINDDNVDHYINLDMTEIKMSTFSHQKDLEFHIREACLKKL